MACKQSFAYVNQTAPLSTTYFTPSVDGIATISAFLRVYPGSNPDNVSVIVSAAMTYAEDSSILIQFFSNTQQAAISQENSGTHFVKLASGVPLTLTTSYSNSASSGFAYDIYILVETE